MLLSCKTPQISGLFGKNFQSADSGYALSPCVSSSHLVWEPMVKGIWRVVMRKVMESDQLSWCVLNRPRKALSSQENQKIDITFHFRLSARRPSFLSIGENKAKYPHPLMNPVNPMYKSPPFAWVFAARSGTCFTFYTGTGYSEVSKCVCGEATRTSRWGNHVM